MIAGLVMCTLANLQSYLHSPGSQIAQDLDNKYPYVNPPFERVPFGNE